MSNLDIIEGVTNLLESSEAQNRCKNEFTRPTHHHRALTIPAEEEEKKNIHPFPFKLCFCIGQEKIS